MWREGNADFLRLHTEPIWNQVQLEWLWPRIQHGWTHGHCHLCCLSQNCLQMR